MKRILSLLLALIMVGSTLVFCAAETEIKVDVRLEEKENGYVDMVFSIPENADLAEFSFDVYYHSAAIIVDGEGEPTFKSNLSQEEEEIVSWQVETDYQNLDASYGEYPCCFISGYTKVGEGLNAGGDLFTLTFKLIDGVPDENYVFNIETDFITNANGDFYTEAVVPQSINYEVKDASIVSYYVSYTKYIPEVSMNIIDEVSKLAWDYCGSHDREFYDIANDMLFSSEGSFSGNNGGRVYSQSFAPAYKYASEVWVKIRVKEVYHGTDFLTIQVRNSYWDNNAIYSNNYPVGSKGDVWIGGYISESGDASKPSNKRLAFTVNKTYYLAFSYCFPDVAGYAKGLVDDNINGSYPLYFSAANQHDGWSSVDATNAFDINYDSDMNNFDAYVSNMGSTFDVDDESNFNNATTYYNKIKNNGYQWNVIESTIRNNYSSASSAISKGKTAIQSFKDSVTAINNGGITISDDKAINDALSAYNSLTTAQRNYSGVSSSKSTLDGYRTTCTNLIKGKNDVQTAINNIGTPVTWSKKSTVESARASYEALNQDQKNNVNNYSTLTAAETTISNMDTARTNFINAVDDIGDVDLDKEDEINNARTKYSSVTAYNDDTLNSDVSSYLSTLTTAESTLTTLKSQVSTFQTDVAGLGTITLSDESTITSLLSTYSGFTSGQQGAVATEYSTLLAAQSTIGDLKNEVQNVKDLIDACYTVDLDKADEIAAARAAYDELDSGQISLLDDETDYTTKLSSAESELSIIQAKVNDLITRIDGIGEVDLNAEKEALVTELQGIYDGFTDVQKAAVTNADVLTAAADRLEELREGVETFKTLVGNIGEVEITDLATIVEAEGLYANFTDGQKAAVETEYQTLLDAREAIDIILGRIAVVEEEINAFGEVTVDNAIEKAYAITSAKEKYDALLSDDERSEVDNKQTLLDAVAALAEAQARVDAMEAEIEALYPIDIDDGDAIAAAETNFAALSESQKGAVENANKLEEARTTYEQMVADVETYKATVNALGVIDLDDQENIELAEELYETFSDLQKDAVAEEEPILTAARTELDALWAEVNGLIGDIGAIGVVTLESEDAIVAARDIYDNELTELQQKAVSNYNVLVDAEIELERLKRQRVTGGIIASNDLSATQTVELVFSGKNAIAGYYFGTSAECGEEDFISYTQNSATAEITQAGTYYLIVKDEYGNLSDTVSVTFVNVALDANGGTVNITDLLIKQNNYVALPTPSYEGKKFLGWARDINVSYGEKTMVDIENGGTFYAIWEDVNVPTIEVTSTNDVATSQTIIVNTTSEEDLAGYYFGNSATYSENEFVATTNTIYNFPVTEAGTYYVTVKDIYDEVSASFAVTFYKVTLNANGGNSAIPYVITKAGNSVQLPLVTKAGAKFLGWSDDVNATSGVNLVIPSSNETYFAIWSQEISISATVGSVTGAKKGSRIEIPVTMDNYSNAYASVCINKVNYDKSVLSFVTFAIPSNSFISHLSSLPQYNNDTMTYSITNIPSNALNAYFTSGGVIAILVFDVLQDVNQYSEVSVGFDKRNTSVYVNGAMDKWTQTINKLEVSVLSGGVNPIIDNQIPTAFISVTKNMANIQAVTLNMFDNRGIAGYYWGMHAFYEANEYVSGNFTTVNKSIAVAGTYYLTVVDIYGNISTTVLVTLCNIILNVEVDEPSQTIVLLEAGVTIELPVYEKDEHSFRGWATQSDAKIGVESLIVVGDAVYYGIFTNDAEASQDVIALIENIGQVTLESETAIDEARYAYNILSDEQKLMITNYDVLEVAEALYYNLANILLGDTNNSGVVGVEDAVLTLHAAIEKLTLSSEQFKAADIDKDGEITTVDVLYILHIISGKYVEQDVQ